MTHTPPQVLLVDDDKFLLDMYAMKFAKDGFTVQSCLSVHDALAVLRGGFAADAIIFDLTMPGEDGYSFLQSMRQENLGDGAKKVALTNQATDEEKRKALELGADDFLVKATLVPSEVVAHIRAVLGLAATS